MDVEDDQGMDVGKPAEEGGKSQELKSAGRKKPTAREMIDSHRLSTEAATGDRVADTRQSNDREGNTGTSGRYGYQCCVLHILANLFSCHQREH